MNAAGSTLLRMPVGFCPPLRCQKGIMANRMRHQINATVTQMRSWRPAGFHQTPFGLKMPECMVLSSAQGNGAVGRLRISTSPHNV